MVTPCSCQMRCILRILGRLVCLCFVRYVVALVKLVYLLGDM